MATTGPLTWERLVAIARRVGVKVVEAPSSHRGKLGKMGSVAGITCHHTGTPNTYKPEVDYPDFNVVKEGRTGLLNSLSAFGIGRFEAIYVFSEFLSWHAGTWNWKGITDGNGHFLGIECAGVGDFTEFQRKVYPRLVAAILLEINAGIDMTPRHMDGAMPRGRKTDAANFTGNFYQGHDFNWWVQYFMAHPAEININYVAPAVEEETEDMAYIIKAPGRPVAALIEGTFIGLVPNTGEEANLVATGAKTWAVTTTTWDAYANGLVTGLPQRESAAQRRTNELLEQLLKAATPAG